MKYGTKLERSDYDRKVDRRRDGIGEVDSSIAGNVILRIGRENGREAGWSQRGHIVLEPAEAVLLAIELLEQVAGKGGTR